MPYYIDLRHKHRESRVLLEYGQEPVKCGELLSRLVSFGNCHAVDDWKEVRRKLSFSQRYLKCGVWGVVERERGVKGGSNEWG